MNVTTRLERMLTANSRRQPLKKKPSMPAFVNFCLLAILCISIIIYTFARRRKCFAAAGISTKYMRKKKGYRFMLNFVTITSSFL